MKNEKRPEGLPTEPTKPRPASEFTAFGWALETKDWNSDISTMLSYLKREAEPFVDESIQGRTAHTVIALVEDIQGGIRNLASQPDQLNTLLMAMFRLGSAAEDLEQEVRLPREQRIAGLKAQISVAKQGLPREMARAKCELAKEYAQDKARSIWEQDHERSIRTGEMTEIIWAWMAEHQLLLDSRPTMPVLKGWLREVARDFPHAHQRGRPGKK